MGPIAQRFVETSGDVETTITHKQRLSPLVLSVIAGDVEAGLIALACSAPPAGHARGRCSCRSSTSRWSRNCPTWTTTMGRVLHGSCLTSPRSKCPSSPGNARPPHDDVLASGRLTAHYCRRPHQTPPLLPKRLGDNGLRGRGDPVSGPEPQPIKPLSDDGLTRHRLYFRLAPAPGALIEPDAVGVEALDQQA